MPEATPLSPARLAAAARARQTAEAQIRSAAPFEAETLACFEAKRPVWGGKTIAVFAPSYQMLGDDHQINDLRRERAAAHLAAAGVRVKFVPNVYRQAGRYAGSDAERAEGLMAALEEPGADLALALRGGYGASRVLPLLDWKRLERTSVPMAGYSDVTALSLAFLAKLGRASWQAPMMGDLSEAHAEMPFEIERFGALLGEPAAPLAFRTIDLSLEPGMTESERLPAAALLGALGRSRTAARFEGTIWGGNLCLIESLLGTPYFPQIEGGILFIEEVGEAAYRVERMLLTLLDAGVLARQKAIVVGDFRGVERAWRFPGDHSLARALGTIRARLDVLGADVPLVTGLPFGHMPGKAALPVGRKGELTLAPEEDGWRASLAWQPA